MFCIETKIKLIKHTLTSESAAKQARHVFTDYTMKTSSVELDRYWQECRNFFMPYYQNGDKAHLINHADDVCNRALIINAELPEALQCDVKAVIFTAYAHDMFNSADRDRHHHMVYDFILKNFNPEHPLIAGFSIEQRLECAQAARSHRASWTKGYSGMLSELIAAADRGCPKDVGNILTRSWLYGMDKLGYNPAAAAKHAITHIREKFSGYMNNSPLWETIYGDQLKALLDRLEELSVPEESLPHQLDPEGYYLALPADPDDAVDGMCYYVPFRNGRIRAMPEQVQVTVFRSHYFTTPPTTNYQDCKLVPMFS